MKTSIKKASFSYRLRSARQRADISQVELAEKLGLSKGAIGNWESGVNPPGLENLKRTAEILGTDLSYLAGDSENLELNDLPAESEKLKPAAPVAPYAYIELSTLEKMLADLANRLSLAPTQERKHILGNITDVLAELERREFGSQPPSKRPEF